MEWTIRWPFRSREHALSYEAAYREGSVDGVRIVHEPDWKQEQWLEMVGRTRIEMGNLDSETLGAIFVWKTRTTRCSSKPVPEVLTEEFADKLRRCAAASESETEAAIEALTQTKHVKVIVASAFLYWMEPDRFQLIDVRSTRALGLSFSDKDYTVPNYLRWCESSRELSREHRLSLRQLDRALFAKHCLDAAHVRLS